MLLRGESGRFGYDILIYFEFVAFTPPEGWRRHLVPSNVKIKPPTYFGKVCRILDFICGETGFSTVIYIEDK